LGGSSNALEDAVNTGSTPTLYALSAEERQTQLEERLRLIDYLVEQGLDSRDAQEKAPLAFAEHIASMNSPDIIQALLKKRFSLAPDEDYEGYNLHTARAKEHFAIIDPLLQLGHQWKGLKKKEPELVRRYQDWKTQNEGDVVAPESSAPKPSRKKAAKTTRAVRKSRWTWELAGESILLAETEPKSLAHGKPVIVRVTHHNVYGPVDAAQLYARVGDPDRPTAFEDLDGGGEWHRLILVEELLSVDGDEVDRSSLDEAVYGETPWTGTYEWELALSSGKHTIETKVVSEMDGINGVISDWIVRVK